VKEYKTPKELFHIIKILTSMGITKLDDENIMPTKIVTTMADSTTENALLVPKEQPINNLMDIAK
jgi:hypothetical protein